jgi:hypothetical protein
MSIELDRPGGGVAAFMLSVSTLVALEKNGTLAADELADIVEQSLARLKTYRCGDERAKPGCMGIRSHSPRAASRESRARSEPQTARGDAQSDACAVSA